MSRGKSGAGDRMRPEYDFSRAVRGKYYERFKAASNVVVLDPDVSSVFPNGESVNQALRALAAVARARVPVARRATHTARRGKAAAARTRRGPRSR